ncbi:unnamed protein product [Mesocestoides corti]|uniref:U1 small nuclear ribonucleoprotein C n=1 Tax=Mesocestoides corti TaxID=53468 RepID=A0A0R3UI80_MESCO|nr:unnamed protein product [Mesocestoides corti]
MPKYYCDYCDKFLTHDSPSVRKTHCTGRTHKNSVREYYQKWLEEQVQKLVDHACNSEAYRQGKVPPPMFGGAMGIPPPGMPGMPPVGAFPPQFPPMLPTPPMAMRPPMGPQGVMPGVAIPPGPPMPPTWGPRPAGMPSVPTSGMLPPQRGPIQ